MINFLGIVKLYLSSQFRWNMPDIPLVAILAALDSVFGAVKADFGP
jgi:small basic protein